MKNKRSLLYIEIIRIIAAFFVIFNHTGSNGFFLFLKYPADSLRYWICLSVSVLCKISVPLFLMISGALLLKKDYTLKDLWVKKILPLIILILLFSGLYYMWFHFYDVNYPVSIIDFWIRIYTGNINYSFWYLYAYLSILIMMPFLHGIVNSISKKHYLYLIGLTIAFRGLFPVFQFLCLRDVYYLNGNLSPMWVLTDVVVWPLIGYYCEHVYDIARNSRKVIISMIIASLISISFSVFMIYYKHKLTGIYEEPASYYSSFIIIPCITIYLGFKTICSNHSLPDLMVKIIKSVGSCTFGIYLLHIIVKDSFPVSKLWGLLQNEIQLDFLITAFTICFVTMVLGYFVTMILKKIPGVKKLI